MLIANRGEIAVRIIRACRLLGIESVLACSTADQDSLPASLADYTVCIGPPDAQESYLYMAAVLEAAAQSNADAIHPGYGFLSEDPTFARLCAAHEVTFVGPTADTLEKLGDKALARALVGAADVPVLPGSEPGITSEEACAVAERIGYPVILKAVAGGGGRGMAIVPDGDTLAERFPIAAHEAKRSFGDGRLYLERYVTPARHIEVQVVADTHGEVRALGLRDCSIQRRHQKLIEETPPPAVPESVMDQMCLAAVRSVRAADYRGVGTVEFIVDPELSFYFLEVNNRIQVEHGVTEMAWGVDLVAEQLRIANGEPLSEAVMSATPRGCVMECRINAEDPHQGFAPTPGRVEEVRWPAGPFVRVDTHLVGPAEIPAQYDSMLGKVLVWDPTREGAINRMLAALEELRVSGPGMATTTRALRQILCSPDFQAAVHHTATLDSMTFDQERATS
ncbi:acetyl-CoA carboxylase biotin carboxylase subunit [Enemella evansiae]|uniref:acetyl-CoA carboxylase biotin carboxylase subunit n=1 Tax=Enemella evansiae TaxID=2016499 RepID=UPI001E402B6B|nr:biotin carboxylase N-terminal domain-containing protein [Enemella evansiae]